MLGEKGWNAGGEGVGETSQRGGGGVAEGGWRDGREREGVKEGRWREEREGGEGQGRERGRGR